MGRVCEVCGKKPVMGKQITTRGRAKYLGGVGTKTTGISPRAFRPNLRTVHVTAASGARKTVRICASCLRSGAVTKVVHATPFKMPSLPGGKKSEQAAAAVETKKAFVAPDGAKVRKRNRKKDA
jgi:large subunit ribosomal protein L28